MKFNNKVISKESRKVVLSFLTHVDQFYGNRDIYRKTYSDNYQDYYDFVFLCGGNYKDYSSRDVLSKILSKNSKVKIIISEELQELKGELDLFSFEILLEAISKMVLISLESMGTACELGMFTNTNEFNKEVVIVDEKYKDDVSFINQGPIEYLKNVDDNRIIYTKFSKGNGKTSLVTNSEVANLYNHKLIVEPIVFTKWFTIDDRGMYKVLFITNLTTFAAYLLDYFFVFYFGTIDDVLFFIKKAYKVNAVGIDSSGIKGRENKVVDVINTFVKIYVRLGILIKKEKCYCLNLKFLKDDNHAHNWAGRIMFVNEFVKSRFFQHVFRTVVLSKYREYLCL